MSLTEFDKDLLLKEIQDIQSTLSFGNVANLETNLNKDGEESPEENEIDTTIKTQEHTTELETTAATTSYYYQPQIDSDDDYSSVSSDEDSFQPKVETGERSQPTFGHFFKAMDESLQNIGKSITTPISTGELTQSTYGQFFQAMDKSYQKMEAETPPAIDESVDSPQLPVSHSFENADQKVEDFEDEVSSVDMSLQSTASTCLTRRKKEKVNMTNLYIERIFRGFHNDKIQNLTVSSVSKIDGRTLKSSANIGTIEHLLQLNRQYQEVLSDELKKVRIAIMKNSLAQDELSTTQSGLQKLGGSSLKRACFGKFMPYFKDKDGMGPPHNEDTKEKKQKEKVNVFCKGGKAWKAAEVKALKDGIYQNNLAKQMEPLLLELKKYDKEYKERFAVDNNADKSGRAAILKKISQLKARPEEEILKASYDIDYFRISKNYVPEREEFECQLYWCNVLHPSINHAKFTKEEDAKILKLSKEYKNRHWEKIAQELDTKRTPVQCLQRFQRTLNKSILKTAWNEEDDAKLIEGVKLFSRDWITIADHVGERTADQCVHRWEHTLNPAIRKGKWFEEEDEKLLQAVSIHGLKNWKVVKTCVPGRTDAQCRERYVSNLDPDINTDCFTTDEDKLLVNLVKQHGIGKWSVLTQHFPGRKDNHLRQRYLNIRPKEFHQYEKQVLQKKKKVLTYFLHRSEERRDYKIEELDLGDHSSFKAHDEEMVNQTRQKLIDEGLSTDDIQSKMAQMKRDGVFVKKKRRGRRRLKLEQDGETVWKEKIFNYDLKEVERKVLRLHRGVIHDVALFGTNCNNALARLKQRKILYKHMHDDLDQCSATLLKEKPEEFDQLMEIVSKTRTIAEKIIKDENKMIKKILKQDVLECRYEPDTPSSFQPFIKSSSKRKARKPMRVVEVPTITKVPEVPRISRSEVGTKREREKENRISPEVAARISPEVAARIRQKGKKARSLKVEQERHRNSDNEEATAYAATSEVLADGPAEIRTPTSSAATKNQPPDIVVTDKLKIFTLLLQALHVDTAGVMNTLPQENNDTESTVKAKSPYSHQSFPACYPLSPNSATLRGFRMLLLQRKKLTDQLEAANVTIDKESFRNTPMYDALNKRFQSLFIWPVFLATFMPRHVQESEQEMLKQMMTPSKLPNFNFNKRMMTPIKRLTNATSSSSSATSSSSMTSSFASNYPPDLMQPPLMPSYRPISRGVAPSIAQQFRSHPHIMLQPRVVVSKTPIRNLSHGSLQGSKPTLIPVVRSPLITGLKSPARSDELPRINTFSKSPSRSPNKLPGFAAGLSTKKQTQKCTLKRTEMQTPPLGGATTTTTNEHKARKVWSQRTPAKKTIAKEIKKIKPPLPVVENRLSKVLNSYMDGRMSKNKFLAVAAEQKQSKQEVSKSTPPPPKPKPKVCVTPQKVVDSSPTPPPPVEPLETPDSSPLVEENDQNVFVPKTAFAQAGMKRSMLGNSVVALETESPIKKAKK